MKIEDAILEFRRNIEEEYGTEAEAVTISVTPEFFNIIMIDMHQRLRAFNTPAHFADVRICGIRIKPEERRR